MKEHIRTADSAAVGILLLTVIQGAWSNAMAQPRIVAQPRNVAVLPGQDPPMVLPGQNAQFKVTAIGDAPLAYQWRFNGASLAGETTNSLAVTNPVLADLGRYDVVVGNRGGTVISAPAWLLLATRWTEFAVFSASDAMVVCSDPGWTGFLAGRLGIPLRNYSVSAASSSDVRSMITDYLKSHTPSTNTLIGLSGGGGWVDMLGERMSAARAASNHLANVRRLVEAGARNFLILRMEPPELVPTFVEVFPWVTKEMGVQFEALLDEGLEELKAEFPLTIYRPDLLTLWTAVWENPTAYGFHVPFVSPYTEVYCDGTHWTLAAQALVSQECYRSLTLPLRINAVLRTADGDLALNWNGGSPPFQIQRTADLLSGQWQPLGKPNSLSEATVKRESSQGFFRVFSLGQ
jgi:hypothetical protein